MKSAAFQIKLLFLTNTYWLDLKQQFQKPHILITIAPGHLLYTVKFTTLFFEPSFVTEKLEEHIRRKVLDVAFIQVFCV